MCDASVVLTSTFPPVPSPLGGSGVRPIAVDLFAGAGGLSLGFEQAGFEIVAAVEYDPIHATTHLFNFPQCEVLCSDISQLTADQILSAARIGFHRLNPTRPWPGVIDAVVGGPPCQGFSVGGKREEDDPRNNLLLEFVRIVTEVRPRTFCLENVAGLLESRFKAIRDRAFSALKQAGYRISGSDDVVDSLHFGVPQVRRRVIVLGSLDADAPMFPSGRMDRETVQTAFEGLPSVESYDGLFESDVTKLRAEDQARRVSIRGVYARRLSTLDRAPDDLSWRRQWDPTEFTNARRTAHREGTIVSFRSTEPGSAERRSRLYRLALNGPSRTLRAGTTAERGSHTSPRPIHPTEPRVIVVREAARLHGFPDWFRFHTTNWHGHRQVGNSVPPPLAHAAARALIRSLDCQPAAPDRVMLLGDPRVLTFSLSQATPIVIRPRNDRPGV